MGQVVPVRQKAPGIDQFIERTPREDLESAKQAIPSDKAGAGFVKVVEELHHGEVQRAFKTSGIRSDQPVMTHRS